MVNQGLVLDVTIDVILGLLAFSFVRWVGATIADGMGFLGVLLFVPFYVIALIIGVYFVVQGLGKLVEDIVRQELARRN